MTGKLDPSTDWQMTYLGWSGFEFRSQEDSYVFIDPPKATVFPDKSAVTIFITHGHPEHLGGTLDYVRNEKTAKGTTIIASKTVCRYLAKECKRKNIDFVSVKPGQQSALVTDVSFEVFKWKHMPLLPPGFGAALRHIWHLLRGFRVAWRIISMSLRGPFGPGDMLGYLLRFSGGKNVIIYGEGLHRKCRIEDVAAIGGKSPGATLLVASEPEDSAELPQLVAASGAAQAILYEPHRPWRDIFKLPHVDMQALQKSILDTGVKAAITDQYQ